MAKAKRTSFTYLAAAIVAALLVTVALIGGGANYAHAADTVNSINVLNELKKDSNFNADDYPYVADDYSISVIQIAESEAEYLYVYTYQPCQRTKYLIATDINMSLEESTETTKFYTLTLASSNGVFCKYRVDGVEVSKLPIRYYNITSIYRAWDKELDSGTGNNNTKDKKAFPVRNLYKVTTENGVKKYTRSPTYVVNILNPYVDFLYYMQSHTLPGGWVINGEYSGGVDSHYIAFSTDWDIDRLLSATVHYEYYSAQRYAKTFWGFDCGGDVTYGHRYDSYAYPTYKDGVEVGRQDVWGNVIHKYTWDKIQTVGEFISTEKLTEETKSNLVGKQWVLRFCETARTQENKNILGYEKIEVGWTVVDRVAVLRLEFETDGTVYDLGAVCDMQSGDGYAGNVEKIEKKSVWDEIKEFFKNLWQKVKGIAWWKWLLMGLAAIVVIALIVPIAIFGVKAVFSFIWWLIQQLFKGLWWLISLPFRAIAKAINKRQEAAAEKAKSKNKAVTKRKPKKSAGKKK